MTHPINLVRATVLASILLCAGAALAGCSNATANNVTSGTPLPVFHQQSGQPSPGELAAQNRANRGKTKP